jgi:hypothetical protein
MRIFSWIVASVLIGGGLAPAAAFDGPKPDKALPVAVTQPGSAPAVRAAPKPPGLVPPGAIPNVAPSSAAKPAPVAPSAGAATLAALPPSDGKALVALQYAADGGHPIAQWKLGQMYATGEGVAQDNLRAFDYFSKVANAHAEDSPQAPQARVIANAFVQLGHYYRDGIPDTRVKADPNRAREMYAYAASYFGDADAQYNLARLYLNGEGAQRDARYAARWLGLAAQKGQYQAQALLGDMLFTGQNMPRQAARGLMWLTLARDSARANDAWINKLYDNAMANASDDERALALKMIEGWVQGRRN